MNNTFEILNSIFDGCNNFVCNWDYDFVISDIIAHEIMIGSSWSCDPDPANKLSLPHPTEAPYEIWL